MQSLWERTTLPLRTVWVSGTGRMSWTRCNRPKIREIVVGKHLNKCNCSRGGWGSVWSQLRVPVSQSVARSVGNNSAKHSGSSDCSENRISRPLSDRFSCGHSYESTLAEPTSHNILFNISRPTSLAVAAAAAATAAFLRQAALSGRQQQSV